MTADSLRAQVGKINLRSWTGVREASSEAHGYVLPLRVL
jgi:hypothetical protein